MINAGRIVALMRQVSVVHHEGKVAPLDGLQDLLVADGHFTFVPEKATPPPKNAGKVEKLQAPVSQAVEVVAEARRTADIDQSSLTVSDLRVGNGEGEISKPVFLPGYRSWGNCRGPSGRNYRYFSAGPVARQSGLRPELHRCRELEMFSVYRTNLFSVNHRLNPVLASVIVQMTELNRHKRAPDLEQLISRLQHYREQPADLNFNRLAGFKEAGLTGKRRLIQARLRDRLFEISRRNRLIYFKPTLQMLNLTVASVPILLDYRNIKLEQLFVWHPELAGATE